MKPMSRYTIATIIFSLSGCLIDPYYKLPLDYRPVQLDDGWEIAAPEEAGIDPAALDELYERFFSKKEFINGVSLLIVRDGRLVAEGYARDRADRDLIHHGQSITKSVTSLVFGILHDDGVFPYVDEPLSEILPESSFTGDARTHDITLRHLLTMTSGLDIDNRQFAIDLLMHRPKHQDRYLLSRKLYAYPGESFFYRDADPQLVSFAVQYRTDRTLENIATERLFDPLGITEHYWEKNVDGVTLGAHALWMKPRDYAKLGQLVLDNGRWNGQQIVPEKWIQHSTSIQIDTRTNTRHPEHYDYGYYWWIVPDLNAITAWGHGGQYIFIVPDSRLLVVLTALPDADSPPGMVLDRFIPIVKIVLEGII